jgi:hypothetical protein
MKLQLDVCREYEREKAAEAFPSATFPEFVEWVRLTIRNRLESDPDMDRDLVLLSTPPHMIVFTHKQMMAYGNHFRVVDDNTPNTVTYDSGLMSVFE